MNFRESERPKNLAAIERHADRVRVITLKTRRHVIAFLSSLPRAANDIHVRAPDLPFSGVGASVSPSIR